MSDDYLWDRSGTPDPDVARLEAMLGRLRSTSAAEWRPALAGPEARLKADATRVTWSVRAIAPLLAAAAAVTFMVAGTWQSTRGVAGVGGNAASWEVARLAGSPRIGSAALGPTGRIAVGQVLVTDAASRARLAVGTIGEVTLDPGSRVRLVETRDGHHRLALDRGTLHASITAPPGQFIVDTPAARATDLGCAYTLQVDEDGTSMISVTAGWVAFELNGLESFVPAGASARTDATRGLGTPRYDNESQAYRDAVDTFDFGDPSQRHDAVQQILRYGGNGDVVTLWHLIARVDGTDRGAIVDALADQAPMPAGVTRDAVLRADRAALDAWWDALGLGDTAWWREWRKPIPIAAPSPRQP